MAADLLSVVLHAAALALLLQGSGAALFLALFQRELGAQRELARRGVRALCLWAMAVIVGQYALEAARLSGELSGVFDATLQGMVLRSATAAVAGARLCALLLAITSLSGCERRHRALAVAGAVVAAGSFVLSGHTAVHPARGLLASALFVHVFAVLFWLGALGPLYRLSRSDNLAMLGPLVRRFSVIGFWIVPLIFIAGTVLAVALIGDLRALREPYGLSILTKSAAFAGLMLLASANKWRLGPALGRSEARALRPFRRNVAAEYAAILCVIGLTAVLTSFFSP